MSNEKNGINGEELQIPNDLFQLLFMPAELDYKTLAHNLAAKLYLAEQTNKMYKGKMETLQSKVIRWMTAQLEIRDKLNSQISDLENTVQDNKVCFGSLEERLTEFHTLVSGSGGSTRNEVVQAMLSQIQSVVGKAQLKNELTEETILDLEFQPAAPRQAESIPPDFFQSEEDEGSVMERVRQEQEETNQSKLRTEQIAEHSLDNFLNTGFQSFESKSESANFSAASPVEESLILEVPESPTSTSNIN